MKSIYQQYLDNNHITRYQVAKKGHVYQSTLQTVANSKGGTDTISGKILKATGKALDKEPWIVFKELLKLEQTNTD
ncbi:hypothetical protein [Loigolactobacillus rennini]|uniref:HTH cro/C1-type domain-containing protein n=1 Tax=Loigolactobacillus rennini DSM 20253 TaxID=1423796 RepID=A0A0R2D715_9LACO|nr:hypothetical protein [Loigolactobacillus rennini]KRM99536.1 hypothetical protein FC24_GL000081 [Loigolactobacillus rennini DSM 20253]